MKKTKLQETHIYTKQDKEKWWGPGIWVEEPDRVEFIYRGISCLIIRIAKPEPFTKKEHVFGGFLCGYIKIMEKHPYFKKDIFDIDIDVHGGITFSDYLQDENYWIGFDCTHASDLTPSTQKFEDSCPELIKMRKKTQKLREQLYVKSFLYRTYKDISFVISECKSMVDQLLKKEKNENL